MEQSKLYNHYKSKFDKARKSSVKNHDLHPRYTTSKVSPDGHPPRVSDINNSVSPYNQSARIRSPGKQVAKKGEAYQRRRVLSDTVDEEDMINNMCEPEEEKVVPPSSKPPAQVFKIDLEQVNL
mmetsp:Transcript_16097/g.24996  ORF Transcript_16097/g.24996 Transcript_16097/m.24996 type:complete len:124 (+) Transcript_16097:1413-1784(+)